MDIAIPSRLGSLMNAAVRSPAAWYAGFALYAAGVALFSGRGLDRSWGIWAAGGYALAFAVAASGSIRGRRPSGARRESAVQAAALAVAVAVAGALAAPLVWLAPASRSPRTPWWWAGRGCCYCTNPLPGVGRTCQRRLARL